MVFWSVGDDCLSHVLESNVPRRPAQVIHRHLLQVVEEHRAKARRYLEQADSMIVQAIRVCVCVCVCVLCFCVIHCEGFSTRVSITPNLSTPSFEQSACQNKNEEGPLLKVFRQLRRGSGKEPAMFGQSVWRPAEDFKASVPRHVASSSGAGRVLSEGVLPSLPGVFPAQRAALTPNSRADSTATESLDHHLLGSGARGSLHSLSLASIPSGFPDEVDVEHRPQEEDSGSGIRRLNFLREAHRVTPDPHLAHEHQFQWQMVITHPSSVY